MFVYQGWSQHLRAETLMFFSSVYIKHAGIIAKLPPQSHLPLSVSGPNIFLVTQGPSFPNDLSCLKPSYLKTCQVLEILSLHRCSCFCAHCHQSISDCQVWILVCSKSPLNTSPTCQILFARITRLGDVSS